MNSPLANPRIKRLTPLEGAIARLVPLLSPPGETLRDIDGALGMVLAKDIMAPSDLPSVPIAYSDGWAVRSDEVVGSGAYGGATLKPLWVNAGDPLEGADAVLPPDAITLIGPNMAEANASAAPGEGVRTVGQDSSAGTMILQAGTRLTAIHLGLLKLYGVTQVPVRALRVRLVPTSVFACDLVGLAVGLLRAIGITTTEVLPCDGDHEELARLYRQPGADLVISIGGTGLGRNDHSVATLAEVGSVECHGVAVRPGAGTAFGVVDGVPVMLLPGRIDAFVGAFLSIVRPALAQAYGLNAAGDLRSVRLLDKANSTIGFDELFLGLPLNGGIRPMPLAEASFTVLAQATGWFAVPPGSEGVAADDVVQLQAF